MIKQRLPLLVLLAIYTIYSLVSFRSFGITNDEPEEYLLGSFLYIKIRGNDPLLEKNFVIDDGKSNLAHYDRLYPATLFMLNGEKDYAKYHLLNLLFFSVLLLFSYELMLHVTKKPLFALIGPIFMLLTPRLFGDAAANPKDIPFAISYFVSLALIYLVGKKRTPLHLLIMGLSLGITQSMRIVGYGIYPIYLIWLFGQNVPISKNKIIEILSQICVVFLIGFLMHMVTLPYLAADPFSNFIALLKDASSFPWDSSILFFSQLINSTKLPWYYIPTWLLITTPLTILILSIFSLKLLKKSSMTQLFWLALGCNGILLILTRPTLYDGLRHLSYLLPILSVLASVSFFWLLKSNWRWKKIALSLTVLNVVLILIQYCLLFPFHYTYFNELVGYLPGANSRFELDYWGASYKSAVEKFNQQAQLGKTYQLYFCGDPQQVKEYARFEYEIVYEITKADLLICHRRGNNQTIVDSFKSENQFSIDRMGVPLTTVKWIPKYH